MKFYYITHSSNKETLPDSRYDLWNDVYDSYLQKPSQQTTINQAEQPTPSLIGSPSTSHRLPVLRRKRKRINCSSLKNNVFKFDLKLNHLRIAWKTMDGVEEHFPSDVILFKDMSKIKLPLAQHTKEPTQEQTQHMDQMGVYNFKKSWFI